MKKITVGTIANSKQMSEAIRSQVELTGAATVIAEVSEAQANASNWSLRELIQADPEIVIVEAEHLQSALQTFQYLHTAMPNVRLLATSQASDPQLIIELMRTGVREFLPSPLTQTALQQAFGRHASDKSRFTHQNQAKAKRGKVFCIMSAKHGSGATTVAVNLAGIIASRGRQRTAVIDLDRPLGDAAAYLNVKPNFTITDALSAGARLDSVLLESYMQATHGFHILPGFREHTGNTAISADKLGHLLEVAQTTFENTIVDLPTDLDEDEVKVITRCASTILVVLTPELPSIWRTERLLSYLTSQHAAEKVRIVLNRSTRSDEISDSDIERLLRTTLYCKLPNEYSACIRAINSGTLLETANSKHLSRALTALASEIAGLPGPEIRRGLFGMILKPSIGGTNA